MKQGKIGVTSEDIFPIIKKFLYSDHEIFLREIVSNAVDATTKLKTIVARGQASIDVADPKVRVKLDTEARTLTISDSGIGMNAEQIEKYINQIAFSGAEEFLEKYKDTTGIIGHFGLGFYSAFLVSSSVEIISKSYLPDSVAVHWTCDGSPEFTLEESTRPSGNGTDIILHLDDESSEYATKERIEGLLTKYCRFLPVAIEFEDKQINDTTPLWTAKPAEITAEQYTEFYHKLYPMAEEPLFHIHLNVDYPFNLTGILYFPRLKNNFEVQKNKIQLYCNQVYVTDSVEGIVPEFLTLLHGVLDSPDIPLNVSRSYLQSDSNVKKISTHITKKVADRLADIFKNQRADYEMNWDELKLFIQYGVVSNEKFGDRASEFSLLKNTTGQYFALDDYAASIKENQTDKNGKIVHLYTA
ncbi:MAG: molecular chaperone HtpG, partial [Mucinivorans sp.]